MELHTDRSSQQHDQINGTKKGPHPTLAVFMIPPSFTLKRKQIWLKTEPILNLREIEWISKEYSSEYFHEL